MTNEEKLEDYEAKLEIVKRHLRVDFRFITLISFENDLEDELDKFIKIIDNAERAEKDIRDLRYEVSDLEDEIKDLKKEIKELKNKNLKNNES